MLRKKQKMIRRFERKSWWLWDKLTHKAEDLWDAPKGKIEDITIVMKKQKTK